MKFFIVITTYLLGALKTYAGDLNFSDKVQSDTIKSIHNGNNLFLSNDELLILSTQGQSILDQNKSLAFLDSPITNLKLQSIYIPNYFLTESAISLPKGQIYYKSHYLLFHTVNYALTNNITIGGGMEFVTLLLGVPVVLIKAKYTFPLGKNFHVGANLVYIHLIPLSDRNFVIKSMGNGIYSGILTYGNADRNVTVNVGRSMFYNTQMFYTFSGYAKVSNKFGFITESFSIPEYYSRISTSYGFGFRINDRKNSIFDLGLYAYSDYSKDILAFPYLAYSLKF